MKRITELDDLIVGKDYLMRSKMKYDNGEKSTLIYATKVKEVSGHKYIGDRIWALPDNNQALDKYDVFGPVDFADMVKNL